MADNPANDPFTRAFDAIQSACANHAPLAALVKADDRINLRVINEVPRKESEDDGDWPEQFLKIDAAMLQNARRVTVRAGEVAQIDFRRPAP